MRRYGLRDDQWDRIRDLLPGREGHVGVTAKDNRLFVEAVLYRYRAGIPWRDLPERFGAWNRSIPATPTGPGAGSGKGCSKPWPPLPLSDRLLIDPVSASQNPQALFTMLYRTTDCLRRAGASVQYLAHSASFQSLEMTAPSKLGAEYLGWPLSYMHAMILTASTSGLPLMGARRCPG
jgi:transposase